MRCEKVRERLGAYADGEMAGALRAGMEEHLAACEGCRDELAALRSLRTLLARIPAPALPEGLEASIFQAALHSQSHIRRAAPLWSLLLRTAAALLVAVAGAYLGMRSSGLLPASPPPPSYPSAATSAESLYAGSFELLPPDSPGAQVLALFQEEGK
jgi:anti-sigma factor RsiW